MKPFTQTKIICTIGPASDSYEMMKQLAIAGMDVMRMNFSHGTHEEHEKRLNTLNQVNKDLNLHIAALLDTRGPEIRTHGFSDGKATIKKGSEVAIYMKEIEGIENKTAAETKNDGNPSATYDGGSAQRGRSHHQPHTLRHRLEI